MHDFTLSVDLVNAFHFVAVLVVFSTPGNINFARNTFGCLSTVVAGPHSAIGRTPDSQVRGPGFDTRSGNILSFLLPLFQEGQLSVTGESMCTKYWLTA